ncbi:MAG: hypothetical protein ACI8Y7_000800 [Candidatus Woesearchaeota archaeon]
MLKRGQASAEFVSVLVIVLILVLVVLANLDWFFSKNSQNIDNARSYALKNGPLGIDQYAVACNGTEFSVANREDTVLTVVAMQVDSVDCVLHPTSLLLDAHREGIITCPQSTVCSAQPFDKLLLINYTDGLGSTYSIEGRISGTGAEN